MSNGYAFIWLHMWKPKLLRDNKTHRQLQRQRKYAEKSFCWVYEVKIWIQMLQRKGVFVVGKEKTL